MIGCRDVPTRGTNDSRAWHGNEENTDGEGVAVSEVVTGLKRLNPKNWASKEITPDERWQKQASAAKREGNALASVDGSPIQPPSGDSSVVAATGEMSAKPIGEIAERIVARVNSDVILAQSLFSPIRAQMAKAQQEIPPAKFAQYRAELIQRQMRDLIERQLLIQEAKKTIPEPGIKRLEAIADKEFGKRIESEMKRMEVNTESELRRKMLESGESLDQVRDFYRGTFLAQQYLRMQLQPRLEVTREEMIDFYNLHQDQFKKDEAVRWSEIFVSIEKAGSRDAALATVNNLVARIRGGADFAELAKTESEGATAPNGGKWELTTKNSYVVPAVDDAIFKLPVGQISNPIEGPKGWHIVRVDERQGGGNVSFVDSQDEIRSKLREQKAAKESQNYVQDLARKATITTIFDKQK